MMAGIRSKNTRPEARVRSALHRLGFRFRKHVRGLPGTPDIVLPKWNAVIEVHGCYWHRHGGCSLATTPDDPTGDWSAKFEANVARDRRNQAALKELGRRVAIVWECAVRVHGEHVIAARLAEWLRSDIPYTEIGAQSPPVS